MNARALAIGIAICLTACVWGTQSRAQSPVIMEANNLAHGLHSFAGSGPFPADTETSEGYCRYLRHARDVLHQLNEMGESGTKGAWAAANRLADALADERDDFYDYYEYYPCWPPSFFVSAGGYITTGQVPDWVGAYLGMNGSFTVGQSRFNFSDGVSGNIPLTGVGAGLAAGYNWQNGQWVYGVEATINASTTSGSTNRMCPLTCTVNNTWWGTADTRIGYTAGNNLFYGKGGLAVGGVQQMIADFSSSTTRAGYNVGAGLERKLDEHWSAKIEYLYVDLGNVPCAETICGPNATTPVRESIFTVGLNWSWSDPRSFGRFASDARLKSDIVTLGHLKNGLAVYRFRYTGSDQVYVGVIAQEVQLVRPDAVVRGDDGFLLVDYDRLGLRMETWDEWVAEQNMPRSNVNP